MHITFPAGAMPTGSTTAPLRSFHCSRSIRRPCEKCRRIQEFDRLRAANPAASRGMKRIYTGLGKAIIRYQKTSQIALSQFN
jgi:hypothetical protein